MTIRLARLAALSAGLALLPAAAAVAHHSNTAFEVQKIETVTGTVDRWEWSNPHVWLYITVKDARGASPAWALEGRPPGVLSRAGWSRSLFKPGDKVTIDYSPAKDKSPTGLMTRVTLADGSILGSNPILP